MAVLTPWQQAAQDTVNQVGFDPNKHPEVTQPASPAARTRYGALAEQQGALAIDGTTHASPPAGEPPKQTAEPVQTVPEGVAVPDPNVNPGGALSATAMNRAAGLGTGTGLTPPPQAPSMKKVSTQVQEQEGKQVMFDMNKIPKPMESQAFNMGLISMGLNLLAGNDIATSFAQGAAAFDQSYGREKREIWAQDLAAQGYDAHEIQAWIASGDPKALSDPMDKKMRMQQYALGQAQLAKAEYESSDEYMQYQQDRQAWNDQMEIARFQSQQNFQNENLRISQANLALSQRKLDMEIAKSQQATQEKFNASKEQAQNHYIRAQSGMKNYESTIASLGDKNPMTQPSGWMARNIPGAGIASRLGNAKMIEMALSGDPLQIQMAREWDDDMTTAILAEKEWLSPVMRKDSGAAVSHSEWNNMGNIYFPRPGDTAEKIAQKAQAREIVTMSMNPNASPQLKMAVEAYNTGALSGLRLVNGQTYAEVAKGKWVPIPMTQF